MNPDEDPEALIRRLEQPLASQGAMELGTARPTEAVDPTAQLPPPVYTAQSPYSAPPFGVSYPPLQKKGAPIGLIFGLIAVAVVIVFAGIGIVVWNMEAKTNVVSTTPKADRKVSDKSVDTTAAEPPSEAPSAAPSTDPEVTVVPSGSQASVAGVGKVQTVACDGGSVSVSGVNNTVTITGHCSNLTVSGVDNKVNIDSAERIDASGFDNQVVFHSGTPSIDTTDSNSVSQG